MNKKIKKNQINNLRKVVICVFIGIVITLILKDFITPIIFNGKSFSGRSLLVKVTIFLAYTSFISIFIFGFGPFLIFYLSELKKIVMVFIRSIFDRLKTWINESEFFELILKTRISWLNFSLSLVISILFYLLLEWIFIISKPSFMTILPLSEKFVILSFAFSFLTGLVLIGISLTFLITKMFNNKKTISAYFLIFPTVIIATTILLMLDNFTYTIFNIGIISSNSLLRILYFFIFLFLILFLLRDFVKINKYFERVANQIPQSTKYLVFIILFFLIITPLFNSRMYASDLPESVNFATSEDNFIKPHIVLITVEGLNASSMSLYGYERDTTPFIGREFSHSALIAKNSFTNSGSTAGSITSILTSKHPTNTRVLYPPDILRSEDAYQHLPGVLKSHGYTTYQFSINHYADAYQINMLNSFDEVNGRKKQGNIILSSLSRYLSEKVAYFYYELNTRLMNRLSHLLFFENKDNTFKQITESNIHYDDFEKFEEAINLLENATSPYFIHIHWMNTHGSKFFPKEQVYSNGQDPSQQDDWDIDFYDDSILEFDSALSGFWEKLKETNQNENTILIITSDHGKKYQTTVRIPMIINFPEGNFNRLISSNVQNLDIAPTLLDYLNFGIPNWMEGKSLINKEIEFNPIISVSTSGSKTMNQGTGLQINNAYIKPPFYQFSAIFVVDCNKWYHFDLDDLIWSNGDIPNYPNPCEEQELLSLNEISKIVFERLSSDGFELTDNVVESINSLK